MKLSQNFLGIWRKIEVKNQKKLPTGDCQKKQEKSAEVQYGWSHMKKR